jgi:outer membrane assembly lipoprotein YfiO
MRPPQPHAPKSPRRWPPRATCGLTRGALGRSLALLLTLALGVTGPVACKTGPDLSADYAQTARENYELALGEFSDEDWDEAIQYADFVRIRFPFSRFSVEAELLVARAEFEQGNYLTSQDAFRQFARLHPTHKHVRNGWVSYMAAVSAYMNGPQSFFLLPPGYQRDQSRLREALVELEYFFDHYGDTTSHDNALTLRDEINRRLLEHELYVARFYLDREKPEAAIGRLESAHARYAGIGLDAEVLFLLGITYLRMNEVELARSTFSELQTQHPKHHHGKQARIYLRYIYDTYGPADPSRKRPDRSPPVPLPPPMPKNRERPERPDLVVPPGTTPPESKTPAKPSEPNGKATPTKAAPTKATPTEAAPTEAAPTEAAPTEAAPTENAPSENAPSEAAPTEAAPPS